MPYPRTTAAAAFAAMSPTHPKIDSSSFYAEYFGHRVQQLCTLRECLPSERGIMYLVGDSTLDNKHWIESWTQSVNGYERVLEPARSKPDVAHNLNDGLVERGLGGKWVTINAAVEESTVGLRAKSGGLLEHDEFVRSSISERDVLVVSCGGNDVALKPTAWTAVSMLMLVNSPAWMIDVGLAPGMGHFVRLFGDGTKSYIENIIALRKPRAVAVCMLYYLDETPSGSWADGTLGALGYNKNPAKLQLIMRKLFEKATKIVKIEGVEIIPVPFFEALDGKCPADYVARVEPSEQGGGKMAKLLLDLLEPILQQKHVDTDASDMGVVPESDGKSDMNIVSMPPPTHLRN